MKNYILKWPGIIKISCLLLVLAVFVPSAIAQVKISGKVTNAKGDGIPSASVSVKNENSGTFTNADGSYLFLITLKKGKVFRTIPLDNKMIVDMDKEGNILGLEILDAKNQIGMKKTSRVVPAFSFSVVPA